MTNNSSSDPVQPDYQLLANVCRMVIGAIGMTTNSMVMYTIFKTKDLRNKSQYTIFSHAIAEFILALAGFQFGLYGCIAYIFQLPAVTQLRCMFLVLPQYAGGALTLIATAGLGIDRLLAAKFALFYRQTDTFRYVMIFNFLVWSLTLVQVVEATVLSEMYANGTVALCTYSNALSPQNAKASNIHGGLLTMITITVYVLALATVGYRYWGTKWLSEAQRSEWARKVQFGAFKTIMILGFMYICFWFLVVIFQFVSTSGVLSERAATGLLLYGGMLLNVNGMTHLFVYLNLNGKFRSGFEQAVLRRQQVTVLTIHITSSKRTTSRTDEGH